jgi:hypothetical protein
MLQRVHTLPTAPLRKSISRTPGLEYSLVLAHAMTAALLICSRVKLSQVGSTIVGSSDLAERRSVAIDHVE